MSGVAQRVIRWTNINISGQGSFRLGFQLAIGGVSNRVRQLASVRLYGRDVQHEIRVQKSGT